MPLDGLISLKCALLGLLVGWVSYTLKTSWIRLYIITQNITMHKCVHIVVMVLD